MSSWLTPRMRAAWRACARRGERQPSPLRASQRAGCSVMAEADEQNRRAMVDNTTEFARILTDWYLADKESAHGRSQDFTSRSPIVS